MVQQYLMHCLAMGGGGGNALLWHGGMPLNFDLAHLTSMQRKWVTKYSQLTLLDTGSLWLNPAASALEIPRTGSDYIENKHSLKYIQSTAVL